MGVLGLLLRASFCWVALVDLVSRWRTCLFKHLGGIKIKGNKRQFLILRGEGVSCRIRRKEETKASTEVLERCSFLGGSTSWGAVEGSLACSRKFMLADRRHEAIKRNQAMLGFYFVLLTMYNIC